MAGEHVERTLRSIWPTLAVVLVALAPYVHADDPPVPAWRAAHGTLENTRAVASGVDHESIATATQAWQRRALGSVTGTPIHADGAIYFADWGGGVHAVRADDGAEIWFRNHPAGADSSVAVDEARVFVADMSGNLTALDRASGEALWSTRLAPQAGAHLYGSPVPHAGRVYQGIASEQTLIEYEGPQDFRGGVACVDAATGEIVWRTLMQPEGQFGISVWSTPAIDPELGLLFVGTGNAYGHPAGDLSDSIVALRMSDGAIAWSYQATQEDGFNARGAPGADADFGASPILYEVEARKLVGDGDKSGRWFTLDRATGEHVWVTRADFVAPNVTPAEKEGFLGTGAYADGVVFAPTTARSMVHAMDVATGDVLWARELNDQPQDYGDRMFGSTTVTNGLVLQGNAFARVFALDVATGEIVHELGVPGDVQGGISVAGELLFVPDAGGVLWDGFGNVTAYRVRAKDAPPTVSTPPSTPPPATTTPVRTSLPPASSPPPATPTERVPDVIVGERSPPVEPAQVPWLALPLVLVTIAVCGAASRRRS